MALHLRIENVPNLPDGGPVEIAITGKRGIDIGRDGHLDWTLPDPTRHISGKHAEIRYQEGGYWLHDVSTNGTFLNGSDHRMPTPRRLRTGDRFTIGHYIIASTVEGEVEAQPTPAAESAIAPPPIHEDLWALPGDGPPAPPIDPRHLKAPRDSAPLRPDFLDWAADVPHPLDGATASHPPAPAPRVDSRPDRNMDWARGARPQPPTPPPPPPTPTPRRHSAPAETETWEQSGPPELRAASGGATTSAEHTRDAAPPVLASHPQAGRGNPDDFVRIVARAAGVSEEVFTTKDTHALAEQLGQVLRIVVDNLSQLLNARGQAKRLIRAASHTVIQPTDNNPLKFSPSAEEAIRIMFGPPTPSYLDAKQALQRGFEDVKTHQVKTYSAMQHALATLLAELDPHRIEQETDAKRGVAAVVTSRKAKLWDAYVARWQAKQGADKAGLLDAFMNIFAQHYDDRARRT